MQKTIFVFFLFILIDIAALSQQTYTISYEDRKLATELTKEAIKDIKNGALDDAYKKLLKSVTVDSTLHETYKRLYQVWSKTHKDPEKIIKLLNKGTRIFLEDDELDFYCGEIYDFESDYKDAIAEYTIAMKYAKINGEDFYLVPHYYLNRGNIYLKSKQYQLALKDYNYMLKLDSLSQSGLIDRGITLYQIREKEKACMDWEKAMEAGSEIAKTYFQKHCNKDE